MNDDLSILNIIYILYHTLNLNEVDREDHHCIPVPNLIATYFFNL